MSSGGRWLRRPRLRLRSRLSLFALLTTLTAVAVFGAAVFIVFVVDERAESPELSDAQVDWDAAKDVLTAMGVALPFALLIAVAGSYWLGKRLVTPIEGVIRTAQDMSAHDLARRLQVPEADDELRALVVTQNALFQRLEEGFDSLTRFAADASHELRTPLAIIENDLEVSLRRPRSAREWEEAARRSLEELQRLNRLVEALLQLARVDAPSATQEVSSSRTVLRTLHERFSREAARREVTFELVEAPSDLMVAIGEDALLVALSNLIANGLRYTGAGGTLAVSCLASEQRVILHVDDMGPGVHSDEIESLFVPFHRARPATPSANKADPDGVGLGLTITKRIVERYRGQLTVGVSPAAGARFSIALPLASAQHP